MDGGHTGFDRAIPYRPPPSAWLSGAERVQPDENAFAPWAGGVR